MKTGIRLLLPLAVLALAACAESGDLVDGAYTATGEGYYGDVVVEVHVSRGRVAEVRIVDSEETRAMLEAVTETLIPEIVDEQTVEGIDAVAGATRTSEAVIEAVRSAVTEAQGES